MTGIGRTPIREAIQRLAREHLIVILPQRGLLVPEIDVNKQLKLLRTRREVERLLCRNLRLVSASPEKLEDLIFVKDPVMKNFFVSYTKTDQPWAEWIAWKLEEAGYTTVIQAWDFRPGANFVLEMQNAATIAEHTIAVLSQKYLESSFTASEWAAALAQDPQGRKQKLVPVRVAPCELTGILAPIVYLDLVGLPEKDASAALLGAFSARNKPSSAPAFPGASTTKAPSEPTTSPIYPGATEATPIAEILPSVAQKADQGRRLSAAQRLQFMQQLNEILPQQFNMLLFAAKPLVGLVPPMPAPQADRASALLAWAEAPGGCGLIVIQELLKTILDQGQAKWSFSIPPEHLSAVKHAGQPSGQGDKVSLGILHITDLHMGQKRQDDFHPTMHRGFMADLERCHKTSGPWDLVLFSGDLAFSGTHDQFKKVDSFIDALYKRLGKLGSENAVFLAVPGNHDLQRPAETSPPAALLSLLSSLPSELAEKIWKEILDDPNSEYRRLIQDMFANYSAWWSQWVARAQPHLTSFREGVLPGEFAVTFEKSARRFGIFGLNTTALQVTGVATARQPNPEQRLGIWPRQFLFSG
jgi:hypothetical protein